MQRDVEIQTVDGLCLASLSTPPGEGPWPAVLMYPDAGSLRDNFRQMVERLSDLGYVVLVPDVYYRHGKYDPIDMRTAFADKESAEKIIGMMQSYTVDRVVSDATSFFDYLASLPQTKPGGFGTTGYCMGGRLSLIVAGHFGDRIAASASFHGGNIANDEDPNSPHHNAAKIKAAIYVAGAIEDRSFPDEQKTLLETSLSEAGVDYQIETYQAHHGFAVPGHGGYDEAAGERHWQTMERFFAKNLNA